MAALIIGGGRGNIGHYHAENPHTPHNPRSGQHEYAQKCGACGQGNYTYTATKCGRCGRTDSMHVIDWNALDKRFEPFYVSGQRIRVETCGMVITGTVGRTTGWKPAYILMLRSNSMGSLWILDHTAKILAVKRGRKYVDVMTWAFGL